MSTVRQGQSRYCSNRKEVKDHGDTGILLGSPIKLTVTRVVIIEDVTTSGKSIEETLPDHQGPGQMSMIIGLDGIFGPYASAAKARSALWIEIKELYGFPHSSDRIDVRMS